MNLDLSGLYEPTSPSADVPSGLLWDAWRVAILSEEGFRGLGGGARLSEMQLAYFAAFGLIAPTSHNTVPQRFELRPGVSEMRVWLDRERVLEDSDPTGRQAAISVGCAIANVELAARCFGIDVEVLESQDTSPEQLRPMASGEPQHVLLATLRFSPATETRISSKWLELMRRRKMVRAEYDESMKLPATVGEEISTTVGDFPGLKLHLLTDALTLTFLGKFQELADSTVINREGFARELGDWLLDNDDTSPIGMRGREFGLSDEMSRRFHLGLRGELELLPDETAGFAKAGKIGMRSASAVGVVTVAKDDLRHRLAAGRAFQRVALQLLGHGFVTSMHAGITEVRAPNLALQGRLRTKQRPQVVFRTGRVRRAADDARPHAVRPTLPSILLPER